MECINVSGMVSKTVKVTHVIIGLNVGGAELMLKRLIESHLDRPDIEHSVISLTDMGVLGEQLTKQGVAVYCLGMASILKGPVTFFKLRKLLRTLRPDVVHTWMYHADLLGGLAAKSVGVSHVVWSIRTTYLNAGVSKVTNLIRKLCAWLSWRLPSVIVCAANASRKVHEEVGYASEKIQVIPNGFDVARLLSESKYEKNVRDELGISKDSKVVISVGRYNPDKDHKTFIKAAALVVEQYSNVKFILVGRGLEYTNAQLMAVINATGKSDSFYLLGERTYVPAYLRVSDVFCLHSVTEGFPNVLGEAMTLGLPCITTNVGDAGYLLSNDDWVVPSANPEKLAEKIKSLLSLADVERQELGKNYAKRIREFFSMSAISQNYYNLYESLVVKR